MDKTIARLIKGEALYGYHSVLQALEVAHRDIYTLYIKAESDRKQDGKARQFTNKILQLAKIHEIAVRPLDKWTLNKISNDRPHQGVILDASPLEIPFCEPVKPREDQFPVLLALDEIQDPQNIGAILRTAHFLGCSGVVMGHKNCAPLSPAVSRASAGALEILAAASMLSQAQCMHEFLARSNALSWRTIGASCSKHATPITGFSKRCPTILVMGNEQRGLRKNITKCCDQLVRIAGKSEQEFTNVDSLNVSVASGILLHELLKC
ncbi:unnamed protein product [Albugo candida]|uniref:rRNA methyltransferase 1, mitochondrial n=1 Tax=Albugo candida TaxID=65357 RepID=A0A024GLD0_9STRA|nr:unnamed protein product [Albugo candida]|eukprot:CCI47147.1 unnamed protein product [Albugo candida]